MVRICMLILVLIFCSCVAVTHNKDKLLNAEQIANQETFLNLNGYYYSKFESEETNYINAIILYEDGFLIYAGNFQGISNSYCNLNNGSKIENSFENSLNKFESRLLYLNSSNDHKIFRSCKYLNGDIDKKGLFTVNNDSITIQYYQAESKKLNKDSFNSYYLYELHGVLINSESFKIFKKINYRSGNVEDVNLIYNFKSNKNKPIVSNYFLK